MEAVEARFTDLVAGDTNGVKDVFVWERATGAISRVSLAQDGGQADAQSLKPDISADGRYVAFESQATSILPDRGPASQVYRFDRQTGTAVRASVDATGAAGNFFSSDARISGDGNVVAFLSQAHVDPDITLEIFFIDRPLRSFGALELVDPK